MNTQGYKGASRMTRRAPGSRRLTLLAACTAFSVVLSACGGSATPATKTETKPAAEATKPAAEAAKPATSPAAAAAASPAAAAAASPAAAAGAPSASKPNAALAAPVALNTLTGTIAVDGSSTVFPVSEAMA